MEINFEDDASKWIGMLYVDCCCFAGYEYVNNQHLASLGSEEEEGKRRRRGYKNEKKKKGEEEEGL